MNENYTTISAHLKEPYVTPYKKAVADAGSQSKYVVKAVVNQLKRDGYTEEKSPAATLHEQLVEELPEPTPENESKIRKLIECNAALIREETLAATEQATA